MNKSTEQVNSVSHSGETGKYKDCVVAVNSSGPPQYLTVLLHWKLTLSMFPSWTSVFSSAQNIPYLPLGSIRQNIDPGECTVKYCPPKERNTKNQLFQYHPTLEGNTGSNHNDS